MSLKYKVFQHSYLGFNGTSTLFYGEERRKCSSTRRSCYPDRRPSPGGRSTQNEQDASPTSTFRISIRTITSDACVMQAGLPEARSWRCPAWSRRPLHLHDKTHLWGECSVPTPNRSRFPLAFAEPPAEVEGHVIEFSDDWDGDSANNTMIWVPSLKVACGTDIVYNDAHAGRPKATPPAAKMARCAHTN